MAWPGYEIAARPAGHGHLRASHADREQVIGTLKAAFVAGMLAKDEFDVRVGQTLASRTYAELADLTADLPAGMATAQPLLPAQSPGGRPLLRPGQIVMWATMVYAGAFLSVPSAAAPALTVLGGFFYLCVLAIALAVAFEIRQDERSARQLPQGPARGAGGPASRNQPPAGLGGQPPPADRDDRHTAEAA